jgi:hypothetical protein
LVHYNSREDILPVAPVDINCCLTIDKKEQLHEIPLQKPLTNILSFAEDLRIATVKIDEIQGLINAKRAKRFEHHNLGNYCNYHCNFYNM